MSIDVARLRADIHETVLQIRETKAPLRTRWVAPMHEHQARLRMLKARATDLCILRAHTRGRVHLAGDAERCRERAAEIATRYAKEEVAA